MYDILELSDTFMTKTFLFDDNSLSNSTNTLISNSKIDYVIPSKRVDGPFVT